MFCVLFPSRRKALDAFSRQTISLLPPCCSCMRGVAFVCAGSLPGSMDGYSTNDERQLKAVMEFRKAYSAQALEGSNIPKVFD